VAELSETDAFYYKSEWDWESGGGDLAEWIAAAALYAVPFRCRGARILATPTSSS
jgi:hypothetical protein